MRRISVLGFILTLVISINAQVKFDEKTLSTIEFRNFGAHRVGAWVSSVAAPENPGEKYKYTFFVGERNGGVWKTINNGVTFTQVFDGYGVNTIGEIKISPGDPNIVWVGTGDSYNARSSYAGNGIYKSVDGGNTFTCMGLKDSQHIARIVIHPKNNNIVYVAAMGHLYSTNEERGVFKTTDGGKTWKKVFYINDKVGVIDLVMSPENPEVLFAAAYEKTRLPWDLEAGGAESALYKTTNGGKNWNKVAGGLPTGWIGRIGVSICRTKPSVIYTLFENLNPKDPSKPVGKTGMMNTNRDNYYDQLIGGEIYRSDDYGKTWKKMNDSKTNLSGKAAYSFNQIFADPNMENRVYVLGESLFYTNDAGKTWKGMGRDNENLFPNMFGDLRTLWIDAKDSRHIMVGSDGGFYISYDGGVSVEHFYNIAAGEFYSVEADNSEPYNIYGGLQDHEAWRAPSEGWAGNIPLDDWTIIGAGDGMYVKVDSTNRFAYSTGQFGQHLKTDMLLGQRKPIVPKETKGNPPYRYTWTTPLIISSHNNNILYTGAQMVLRSKDAGETWIPISPDLTTNDSLKNNGRGHIKYCTITTISESPISAEVIWAGTDDGKVQYTADGGKTWNNCTAALTKAGCPEDYWVTRVFASNNNLSVCYVTKSGYSKDIFKPFIFKTTDYGKTWINISSNLPDQPVNVICEDKDNSLLLFAGTDAGAYVTINGGSNWIRFINVPQVPVKDIQIQKKENDLLIATFGRGIYTANISSFKVMNDKFFDNDFYLFDIAPKPQKNYSEQSMWGNLGLMGGKHLATPNLENGLIINYYLKNNIADAPKFEIIDSSGKTIRTITGKKEAGLQNVVWDTSRSKPGNYTIKVTINGKEYTKTGIVKPAWIWPVGNQSVR